ncbi:uncharacterized protein [Argopecten irradians]|uniref:uncharacterized protein n=1 Tax=Argopecten irradians TaxID=31199 RepID=UPI003716A480
MHAYLARSIELSTLNAGAGSTAYRSGFGCQTTVLRMLEDWRQALDCRNQVGSILMDLSKAFDCLPHDLFLRKLQTYGASADTGGLMGSYLGNRKQRVGLRGITSE